MNLEWVGYAAAALTSASFIPQAVMTIRTRDTRGISRGMYIIFTVGVALWLVYGIALELVADDLCQRHHVDPGGDDSRAQAALRLNAARLIRRLRQSGVCCAPFNKSESP